jgi:hypothetical protein
MGRGVRQLEFGFGERRGCGGKMGKGENHGWGWRQNLGDGSGVSAWGRA